MMSILSVRPSRRASALALLAVLVSGCTVQKQSLPGLAGPSELGLSIDVTAAPQILPRDGSSMSTITIVARNADGSPRASQRLRLLTNAGTLSVSEVNTTAGGIATVTYIAPGLNENVSTVTVEVVPVEVGDIANANTRTVQIAVIGPSIPTATFTFPEPVTVGVAASFDGSQSTLNGSVCGATCSYSWSFGDGGTASGPLVQHTFTSAGVQTVTLTVTSPTGTSNSVSRSFVAALPAAPVAAFAVTPDPPVVNTASIFNASGSTVGTGATIAQYLWDFGDGTTATSTTPVVSKTYGTAGAKGVTLTVTDSLGRTNTLARTITVNP